MSPLWVLCKATSSRAPSPQRLSAGTVAARHHRLARLTQFWFHTRQAHASCPYTPHLSTHYNYKQNHSHYLQLPVFTLCPAALSGHTVLWLPIFLSPSSAGHVRHALPIVFGQDTSKGKHVQPIPSPLYKSNGAAAIKHRRPLHTHSATL